MKVGECMKRIQIHYNYNEQTLSVKRQVVELLKENGFEITSDDPELIVVIGGDGTMLSAIRKYYYKGVPFVGVNTGTLGFLPTICRTESEALIDILNSGEYRVQSYPLLQADVETVNGEIITRCAFNEILIKHLEPRLMKAKLYINDKPFNYFAGDGFIVSTPIGATGYAMWAGGVAMHCELPIYQLTPITPNDNSVNRPMKSSIILPEDTKLYFEIVKAEYREVMVACDGVRITGDYIKNIHINVSDKKVKIIRRLDYDYFQLYRNKIIDKQVKQDFF